MNCLQPPKGDDLPDFCGVCANCTRIAQADALEERFAEAVETRENLRDADKRETRIFVQTHPDVTVIPPDPPQMLVKVDQVPARCALWFICRSSAGHMGIHLNVSDTRLGCRAPPGPRRPAGRRVAGSGP